MADRDVQIELNFIDEFELSRQGMIKNGDSTTLFGL